MTAYWIGRVKVTDEAAYGEYAKRAGPIRRMENPTAEVV